MESTGEHPLTNRTIRSLTSGKPLEATDQESANAIQSGSHVMVKAGSLIVGFPQKGSPARLDNELLSV